MYLFKQKHGGRRVAFEVCLPSPPSSSSSSSSSSPHRNCTVLSIVAVDSHATHSCCHCAAMLVPKGCENEWIYTSQGGQFQLLASASASRLLLVFRSALQNIVATEDCDKLFIYPHNAMAARGSYPKDGLESSLSQSSGCESLGKSVKDWRKVAKAVGQLKEKQSYGLKLSNSDALSAMAKVRRICVLKGERLCEGHKYGKTLEHFVHATCGDMKLFENGHGGNPSTTINSPHDENGDAGNPCRTDYSPHALRRWKRKRLRKKKRCKEGERFPVQDEDEHLKAVLAPLMNALAPVDGLHDNYDSVPFISYEDDIVRRFIVEEAFSPLIGAMVVEDVEISQAGEASDRDLADFTASPQPLTKFRRRLRFKRMPNLIQTEVPLVQPSMDEGYASSHSRFAGMRIDLRQLVHVYLPPIVAGFILVAPCLNACIQIGRRPKVLAIGVGGGALLTFLHQHFMFDIHAVDLDATVLDLAKRHFGLVEHEHLKLSVADGLGAVMEVAERSAERSLLPRELCQAWQEECLKCSIVSTELGYRNCVSLKTFSSESSSGSDCRIQPACGECISENLSSCENGAEAAALDCGSLFQESIEKVSVFSETVSDVETQRLEDSFLNSTLTQFLPSQQKKADETKQACQETDPRVHLMIIDVDADNACLDLSSPPQEFLEKKFLLAVRIALHEGGMLAMNVLPSGKRSYVSVIATLKEVFHDVYEIRVGAGENYVVFALPAPVKNLDHNSVTAMHVRSLVAEQLIGQIQKSS